MPSFSIRPDRDATAKFWRQQHSEGADPGIGVQQQFTSVEGQPIPHYPYQSLGLRRVHLEEGRAGYLEAVSQQHFVIVVLARFDINVLVLQRRLYEALSGLSPVADRYMASPSAPTLKLVQYGVDLRVHQMAVLYFEMLVAFGAGKAEAPIPVHREPGMISVVPGVGGGKSW